MNKYLEVIKWKAREDFWSFCLWMDHDFFTERKSFLKPLATMLQEAYEDPRKKVHLNYSLPRRVGKTYTTNLFCAWLLGKDHAKEIIRSSYSRTKTSDDVQSMMFLMQSDKYKLIFSLPDLEIDTQDKKVFKGHYRASIVSTGIQNGATGVGGAILICDDLYKNHEEAGSQRVNDKVISNYLSSLSSSLDNDDKNLEILIGTRWRVGELADRLENEGYFDYSYKLPALNEQGESNIPCVLSTEELLKRREQDKELFEAMYQQKPMISKSALFALGDFDFITEEEFKKLPVINRFAYIDPKSTGVDFFAMPIIAVTNKGLVLEDLIYTNDPLSDDLLKRVVMTTNKYQLSRVYVETNKEYTIKLWLEKNTQSNIIARNTTQNKELKIQSNAHKVKQIKLLYTQDQEYNRGLNELWKYDNSKLKNVDDLTDALTMICIEVDRDGRELGWTFQMI